MQTKGSVLTPREISPAATTEAVDQPESVPESVPEVDATRVAEPVTKGPLTGSEVAAEVEAEAAKHAQAWVAVFDISSARLGPSLAAEVMLPPVFSALER